MKRCPTCKRTFDDSLSYCLDDGTPLVIEDQGPDSEQTLVSPSPRFEGATGGSRELLPTHVQPSGIATSHLQAPPIMPSGGSPRRRVWPWIVAAILIVVFLIFVIIMAVALPRIMSRTRNANRHLPRATPHASPYESPGTTPAESPAASPAESTSETEAPTDEDEVLTQLTDVEKKWTEANVSGDKSALEPILAAEYSSGDPPHSKRQYLDSLKPDPTIKSWVLRDLTIDLNGDEASLHGFLNEDTTRGPEVYDFTDTFVWRDGRWQATGSRASRVK